MTDAGTEGKRLPSQKIDREGLTWTQRREKIETAVRLSREAIKTGKISPAPAIKKP